MLAAIAVEELTNYEVYDGAAGPNADDNGPKPKKTIDEPDDDERDDDGGGNGAANDDDD